MLVHRVNYVLGVREIVTGEILWPTFHSQGAELDDTVLSDALPLRLCVVRVTKILALSLANRLSNGVRVLLAVVGQIERRVDILLLDMRVTVRARTRMVLFMFAPERVWCQNKKGKIGVKDRLIGVPSPCNHVVQ